MPCKLVSRYSAEVSPEDRGSMFIQNFDNMPISLHFITSQKTDIDIFTAISTSNLI